MSKLYVCNKVVSGKLYVCNKVVSGKASSDIDPRAGSTSRRNMRHNL